jgi:O-succinylbenzoate synthase
VRVTGVELRRVRLPLVSPFRTAGGDHAVREAVLVKVEAPEAEGWGECAALAEPTYSPEYVDGAHAVMRDHLVPRLLAGASLDEVSGHRMAKAALRMALLDAELRLAGRSLAHHLGATRATVPAGVAVGLCASVGELVDAVAGYVEQGYVRVKLKVRPGWDVEPVAAVRERFPDLPLQVDANSSYFLADLEHLRGLDDFGLLMIEQPLAEDDLLGHARLAEALRTPICLDESIVSVASAMTALELGACSIVNVKPGRVGGLDEAKRIHDLCVERGAPVWCGGMLETGIGRAANLALAALPGFTLPGDLSASSRYYERDLTAPFVLEDGHIRVPTGPGIGATPDSAALAEATVSVERLSSEL